MQAHLGQGFTGFSPTVIGGSTFGGGRPKKEKAEKVVHSGLVWLRLRHWKEQEGGGKEEEEGKEEKELLLYTVLPISMRMILLRQTIRWVREMPRSMLLR